MTFDPYAPYGTLAESAVRVVTWNVWGRYGPAWKTRQVGLEDTLVEVAPDVICLVEAWRYGETSQPGHGAPWHRPVRGPNHVDATSTSFERHGWDIHAL